RDCAKHMTKLFNPFGSSNGYSILEKLRRRGSRLKSTSVKEVSSDPIDHVEVLAGADKQALKAKYQGAILPESQYATIRDYCDSADWLSQLMTSVKGLRDVQSPWMVKSILSMVPPNGRLMEIGNFEPRVASALAELGYHVTVVDPYDSAEHDTGEYHRNVSLYPRITLLRDDFGLHLPFEENAFDAIYSVSVLEHLTEPALSDAFAAIRKFLRRGGVSIHCAGIVIEGNDADSYSRQAT